MAAAASAIGRARQLEGVPAAALTTQQSRRRVTSVLTPKSRQRALSFPLPTLATRRSGRQRRHRGRLPRHARFQARRGKQFSRELPALGCFPRRAKDTVVVGDAHGHTSSLARRKKGHAARHGSSSLQGRWFIASEVWSSYCESNPGRNFIPCSRWNATHSTLDVSRRRRCQGESSRFQRACVSVARESTPRSDRSLLPVAGPGPG